MKHDTCMYAVVHEGTADERRLSREHVLPEAFGGSLTLPNGAVCKACNNRINHAVDIPCERTFRSLLNFFRTGSRKRGRRDNAMPVVIEVGRDKVEGRLLSDGSLRVKPGLVRELKDATGKVIREYRAMDAAHADQMIKQLGETYSWDAVETTVTESSSVRLQGLSISGSLPVVYRAAAKIILNYLAWREHDLVFGTALDGIKDFIMHETDAVYRPKVATSREVQDNALTASGLTAHHHVAVGSAGKGLVGTVVFFGQIPFHVVLSPQYSGEPFHFEHDFDGLMRTDRIVDFWGHHPAAFPVTCAGDCEGAERTRIRRSDGPPQADHIYVHELYINETWRRCDKCSAAIRKAPPSGDVAHRCHAAASGAE